MTRVRPKLSPYTNRLLFRILENDLSQNATRVQTYVSWFLELAAFAPLCQRWPPWSNRPGRQAENRPDLSWQLTTSTVTSHWRKAATSRPCRTFPERAGRFWVAWRLPRRRPTSPANGGGQWQVTCTFSWYSCRICPLAWFTQVDSFQITFTGRATCYNFDFVRWKVVLHQVCVTFAIEFSLVHCEDTTNFQKPPPRFATKRIRVLDQIYFQYFSHCPFVLKPQVILICPGNCF